MASIKASLDTNILLRLILRDDAKYFQKSLSLLQDTENNYFVDDIVFHEIEFVLSKQYGFSRKTIATFIANIILTRHNIVCRNKSLIFQALEDYVLHPKLSFSDCYLACNAALEDRSPLLTFDRKLASQLSGAELLN